MNRQEIYNTVRDHLLKQKQKSQNHDSLPKCMYHGPDGLMCAIGPLIPDHKYHKDMEGNDIDAVIQIFGNPFDFEPDVGFLNELQHIHDYRPVHEWGGALMRFACDHNLDP